MPKRLLAVLVAAAVSCSAPTPASSPAPSRTDAPSLSPLPAGARAFVVVPERSSAVIRVREQIAGVPAPGDAVLTTRDFSGRLVLLPDGTFAAESTVVVALDSLDSDSDLRDEWIKVNTLQTRRYPHAEFTARRLTGVPLPLPEGGEWTARLEGTMRIHGVERALTWELRTMRRSAEVRVTGSTSFRFGDYGMEVPANRLILSVVDDVRLEIDLIAADG